MKKEVIFVVKFSYSLSCNFEMFFIENITNFGLNQIKFFSQVYFYPNCK